MRISQRVAAYSLTILCMSACGGNESSRESDSACNHATAENNTATVADSVQPTDPAHEALLTAYPDFIKEISGNQIHMRDGSSLLYDDGKEKDFRQLLDDADAEDMFYLPYHRPDTAPEYLEDAGRIRYDALFKKMYGSTAEEVRGNLVKVDWFGQSVQFNRNNGAADSLRAVATELMAHHELKRYLKSSGTFNWRPVRGAGRMSAHAYGIAFDIGVEYSDYWQWKSGSNDELAKVKYSNRIPTEIVDIFERHGFIWGGSWYHFDTMHFEFRPEILHYARINP